QAETRAHARRAQLRKTSSGISLSMTARFPDQCGRRSFLEGNLLAISDTPLTHRSCLIDSCWMFSNIAEIAHTQHSTSAGGDCDATTTRRGSGGERGDP